MLSTHARHSPGFATGNTVTAKVSMSAPPSPMAGLSLAATALSRETLPGSGGDQVETRWPWYGGLPAPEGIQVLGRAASSHDRPLFRPDASPGCHGKRECLRSQPTADVCRRLLRLLSPLLSALPNPAGLSGARRAGQEAPLSRASGLPCANYPGGVRL